MFEVVDMVHTHFEVLAAVRCLQSSSVLQTYFLHLTGHIKLSALPKNSYANFLCEFPFFSFVSCENVFSYVRYISLVIVHMFILAYNIIR